MLASHPAVLLVATTMVASSCQCGDNRGVSDSGVSDATTADAAADAAELLPDLTVDFDRARADLAIREASFEADACELDPDEACVNGSGERRLLHFSVETPNVGGSDMVLGPPAPANEQFEYSVCHDHFHFLGYAEYRLLDARSNEVAAGRKQAFCLLDSARYLDETGVATTPRYDCEFQGIQHGWSDVYHSSLACQFVDVTDLPPGPYSLEIRINNGGTLPEASFDNNVVVIPVDLASEDLRRPSEACPRDMSTHASDGLNRECGWTLEASFDCVPGTDVHIGCSANCGMGSCSGDPVLRICDGDRPDGNCSFPAAIDEADDACGGNCPAASFVRCPSSGQLDAYSAPFRVGAAYRCEVVMETAGI